MKHGVIGWDVGGVNTKVARVAGGVVCQVHSVPYEIQRAPEELGPLIARLAREIGTSPDDHHAVTMTAELSQYFRSKREGVGFVLDAFESALPASMIQVYGTDGIFRDLDGARRDALRSAASNWVATAAVVARTWRDAVLIDVGTTTTDIIPIADGAVVARGRTDAGRLLSGELLYLGAIRTPVEAIVHEVPLREVRGDLLGDERKGAMAGVSAESFALAGDAYLWLGEITEDDYSVPTPDGRPATRVGARDRLARVVCADGEMLDDSAITAIARHVAGAQVERMARSLSRVLAHHPSISIVVTAGLGSFLARRAADRVGVASIPLGDVLGVAAARSAPAAAVALLLAEQLGQLAFRAGSTMSSPSSSPLEIEELTPPRPGPALPGGTVIKVGGALLGRPDALDIVIAILAKAAARGAPMLIVPGGGPFADTVRAVDRERGLTADAAHWMAILAMNQYAELLASRIPRAKIIEAVSEIAPALAAGLLPILAPYRWLRNADPLPLPHSWEVTSDSIAAWVAGQLGADRLVLVKAGKVDRAALVDRYFERALPSRLELVITDALECGTVLGV